MHGAATIDSIQEKEVLGETQVYYVFSIALGNIQVMVPTEKTSHLGIRHIVNSDIMDNVLSIFHNGETDSTLKHIHRHRMNATKLKSGDIYEGAQVLRDLVRIAENKVLGNDDRQMLNNARQFLISELILVKDIEKEQAEEILDQVIYT